VIGGTGLAQIEGFTPIASVTPSTPWGAPSSAIQIVQHNGVPIAFLARHGIHHQHAPHEVPNRANIAALRSIGVRCIVAFSAVGSLREEIAPEDFVVPDQVIDRTKGIRPFTFFDGGVVGHVGFADPFDGQLAQVVKKCADNLNAGHNAVHSDAPPHSDSPTKTLKVHVGGTIICMEGPQFSTRAESHMYRSWGGSVINMSALPEAKLAREAEVAYQMICMATDYDCWRAGPGSADVDVAMVMQHMAANANNAKRLIGAVLDELTKGNEGLITAKHWEGTSSGAVKFITKPAGRDKEAMKKIEYLFPGIWSD
jgi:5'-methylthioadenosine phosphorylase